MNVKVHFPQEKALALGIAKWGLVEVDLEPILIELDAEERVRLYITEKMELQVVRFDGRRHTIDVDSLEFDDTVKAIRDQITLFDIDYRKELDKLNKILEAPDRFVTPDGRLVPDAQDYLIDRKCKELEIDAAPYKNALALECQRQKGIWTQEWRHFFEDWTPGVSVEGKLPYHQTYRLMYQDMFNVDNAEKIARHLGFDNVLRRIEVYRQLEAQKELEAERKATEAKEREARSRHVWLEWAKVYGTEDLRFAIRDGYPLGQAVEREVERVLFPKPGSSAITVLDEVSHNEDRRVPNQAARSLRAYLVDQVESAGWGAPAGVGLEVGRIQAVKYWVPCDRCGGDEDYCCGDCDGDSEVSRRRTAVPVYLRSPHHNAERWYVLDE